MFRWNGTATATGTAAYQGYRTESRVPCDIPKIKAGTPSCVGDFAWNTKKKFGINTLKRRANLT